MYPFLVYGMIQISYTEGIFFIEDLPHGHSQDLMRRRRERVPREIMSQGEHELLAMREIF